MWPRSAAASARASTTRSRACSTHCQFINGPEVRELERELAAFCGARHAIGVRERHRRAGAGADGARASGRATRCSARPSPSAATAEVVALVGATPVFVDVERTRSTSIRRACERAVATAKRLGLTPKAVMPVDLFGLPADYDAIAAVAERARPVRASTTPRRRSAPTYKRPQDRHARRTSTATSFFPAKPLGCYGDGGAMFTDDDGARRR